MPFVGGVFHPTCVARRGYHFEPYVGQKAVTNNGNESTPLRLERDGRKVSSQAPPWSDTHGYGRKS